MGKILTFDPLLSRRQHSMQRADAQSCSSKRVAGSTHKSACVEKMGEIIIFSGVRYSRETVQEPPQKLTDDAVQTSAPEKM